MTGQNSILKERVISLSRWDFYAVLVIFFVLVLQALNWYHFPLFLDCYYHLSVMMGFADAGGWVGVSFWEYAPFGRPHLYPPLFHILELAVFKSGFSPITVARFFDFLIYPFFLFIDWRILRDIFSKELAFFNLLLLASSYPLYLAMVNNIPFVLALLAGILSFYFIQKGRLWSSVLCLALSFYAHSLMSWISFAAIFIYGLLNTRTRKAAFLACLGSCVLASPFLIHQAKYYLFFNPVRVLEFFFFSATPVLYLLSFFGLLLAYRKRGPYLFFVALAVSMSALLFTNRDRFFSGQGCIPASFLAAVVIDDLWKRIFLNKQKWYRALFFAVFFLVFFLATPVVVYSPEVTKNSIVHRPPLLSISSRVFDESGAGGPRSEKGMTFYHPAVVDDMVRLVTENSSSEDIVFSNYSYGGGMITALANRATSGAMLHEVLPFDLRDPVAQARLVLVFKDQQDRFFSGLPQLVERYGLRKIGETDLAALYSNDGCGFVRQVIPAKIPFWLMFGLFFAVLASIYIENKLMKKKLT